VAEYIPGLGTAERRRGARSWRPCIRPRTALQCEHVFVAGLRQP
jgi:hypothetical protein